MCNTVRKEIDRWLGYRSDHKRMRYSSLFILLLFLNCGRSIKPLFLERAVSKEVYEACFQFLGSNDLDSLPKGNEALDRIVGFSKSGTTDIYPVGEVVFDPQTREGRHLHLDRYGRLEYFRKHPAELESKEAAEFLCAETVRWVLEARFQEAATASKKEPLSTDSKQLQEENVKDYIRLSLVLDGKSQRVRDFLFLYLSPYLKMDKGLPMNPCGISSRLQESIRIAVFGRSEKNPASLAWTSAIQSISAYELGFTLAGHCK